MFSFRIALRKPLKSFWFFEPRNLPISRLQCYQRLTADSISRFFSATFSRNGAEVCPGSFSPNIHVTIDSVFGKQNTEFLRSGQEMAWAAGIAIYGDAAGSLHASST
jgi:hypothetical protein